MKTPQSLFRIETPSSSLHWQALSFPASAPSCVAEAVGHLKLMPQAQQTLELQGLSGWAGDSPPLNQALPGPPLYEQCSYRLSLKAKQGQRLEIRHPDPEFQSRLQPQDPDEPDRIVAELNFRSHVGYTRFEVWLDGQPDYRFELEVFPSKITYKDDFQRMLAEVQEILSALAFQYLSSTWLGGSAQRSPAATQLEWVLLLSQVISSLERALRQIARQPVRQLQHQPHWRAVHSLRKVDAGLRNTLRKGQGQGPFQQVSQGLQVRSQVLACHSQQSLDTPEHRWLAQALQQLRQKLAQILMQERQRQHARPEQVATLLSLERRVTILQQLEPLAAATATALPAGFSSLQLMRAGGYREAYRALLVLRCGLNLQGQALEVSLKDVATLYEYWSYLVLVSLLAQAAEQLPDLQELIAIQQGGLQVRLQQGQSTRTRFVLGQASVALLYNPQLSQDALLPHQPDMLLEVTRPGWPVYRAVLDAKYRIDHSETTQRRLGLPAPPPDALNVLHRYRDAILSEASLLQGHEPPSLARTVVQGLALYPYVVRDARQYPDSALFQIFKRLGIGAIPLLPSQTQYLASWLQDFLTGQPWSLAMQQIPVVLQPTLRQAASEGVLIGCLRGQDPQAHWDWLQAQRCYYLPVSMAAHGRQWRVQWVALYFPRQLSPVAQGAICVKGRVERLELLPRKALATPWSSRRAAEQVLVYHVSSWEAQPPIPNLRGERVNPRWSTHLGLSRAQSLNELLLESVPEWQLYEALQQAGLAFQIRAHTVPQLEQAGGHACFELACGLQLRYLGVRGYLLQAGKQHWRVASLSKVLKQVKIWGSSKP